MPWCRLGFGGEHLSRRVTLSNQAVPAYTIFDVSLTEALGPAELLLRVDNLFDRRYTASGFTKQTGSFPGEPRSLLAELRLRF